MSSAIQIPDSGENLLLNSNFQVAQLGTSFTAATTPINSDDTYLLDQWILLSDGNDVVDVSQDVAEQPAGSGTCLKSLVATANKKFGYLQVLENKRAMAVIGDTVSLSFAAKKVVGNATLETLRAAVISWDSTADTVTSDVVSAWSIAGTDPVLVANWTYENTPSNLTLTDSYQTFKIEGISVDTASTTNVGVFIWCDDADATAADIAYIGNVKLEATEKATEYTAVPFDADYTACQRFLEKSFAYATAPAQSVAAGASRFLQNVGASAASGVPSVNFSVKKRVAPTMTLYNPGAANAQARNLDVPDDCTSTTVTGEAEGGFNFTFTSPAGSLLSEIIAIQWLADSRL
jgi:hypothetical protein